MVFFITDNHGSCKCHKGIRVFENLVSLKVLAGVQEGPNYLLADPFIYVVFFISKIQKEK